MMNRSVMNRQMFKKGGAAGFPDLSGDGKITRKDVLMGRGVEFKQDGGPAGRVPNDVQAIFNGLVNAMRGSKTDVAGYVAQNQQDLMDIAKMFPNTAPMIEEGFKTFMGMMGPGESVTESPLTTEENGRFNVYPPTQMQMGGEPMAAAMEQGNMAPAPMPANLGPAEMDGIASQVNPEVLAMLQGAARSFGDPEQAESFEEMMNMVRGVPATEEERRQELAGVVGPSDAQQTPDSVLALLQPTMLLMGLPETEVDTGGIGPMAQTAMDVPVQGDMAEGIMSMAAPASEGASPPVNFNQGGEVLRFENGGVPRYQGLVPYARTTRGELPVRRIKPAPDINVATTRTKSPNFRQLNPVDITSAVTGISTPTTKSSAGTKPTMDDYSGGQYEPTKTLRELYQERLPLLEEITAAGKDNTAAQIQFFSDLAKAGAAFAQPTAPGQSVVSKLAQSLSESGISENVARLAASRAATEQALKLKAFEGAEKELSAEEATRRASALQAQQALTRGIEAFKGRKFEVKQGEDAFARQRALKQEEAALNDLTSRLEASRSFMSQAEILARQGEIEGAKIKLSKALEANAKEVEHQRTIDTLNLTQAYKLEAMSEQEDISSRLQVENNLAAAALQRNRLEQEKTLKDKELSQKKKEFAYRKEQDQILNKLKKDEIAIKQHAADLKRLSEKAKQYEKPGAYVPALLNEVVPYVRGAGTPSEQKGEEVYYKLWGSGEVPENEKRAREISTMLENAMNPRTVYEGPEKGYVLKPAVRYSPEIAKAIVDRGNRVGDISERVRANAEIQLAAGNKNALNKILEEMDKSTTSMFDGMAKIAQEPVSITVSKAASDLKDAFGATGLATRALNLALRFADMPGTSSADRGAYIARRIFVDGLTASLAALPGKENVKIQDLLTSVIPGDFLVANSPESFYSKAQTYLGSLEAGIDRLERSAKIATISPENLEKRLMALNELYSTRNGVLALMKELDLQNNITGK